MLVIQALSFETSPICANNASGEVSLTALESYVSMIAQDDQKESQQNFNSARV